MAIESSRTTHAVSDIQQIVDNFGLIRAQIAELREEEDRLRSVLIELGGSEYDGTIFRATVSSIESKKIDYRSIVKECHVPKSVLDKHTKTVCVFRVSIRSRKKV